MSFYFRIFEDDKLNEDYAEWLVDEQSVDIGSYFGKFWDYYHNNMYETAGSAGVDVNANESSRPYVQAQEYGLPTRITGVVSLGGGVLDGRPAEDIRRKEVVIENDITWRINAMVDFLFGKGVSFVSKSPEAHKRREIEQIIKAVFNANGGVGFFQDMAVLGSVYGFVDCVVRPGEEVLGNHSIGAATASRDATDSSST